MTNECCNPDGEGHEPWCALEDGWVSAYNRSREEIDVLRSALAEAKDKLTAVEFDLSKYWVTKAEHAAVAKERDTLRAELREALKVMESVEWTELDQCPVCDSNHPDWATARNGVAIHPEAFGHKPDCALAARIAAIRKVVG